MLLAVHRLPYLQFVRQGRAIWSNTSSHHIHPIDFNAILCSVDVLVNEVHLFENKSKKDVKDGNLNNSKL